MKSLYAFPLLLAAATLAAATPVVETANGDWSRLPQLSQRGYEHLSEKMQAKLYEIAGSHQCPSFALNNDRLDFRMAFATQYAPDGSLARVVLPKLDCAEAESVVGGTLLEMLQAGDYAPTGKSPAGWYQGTLGFSFAGKSAVASLATPAKQQQGAIKTADPNEILCEKTDEIGTRLSNKRTCMSRAEWAEQKRLTRETVEKVQTLRPCNFNC
jgi:hypothetical protein